MSTNHSSFIFAVVSVVAGLAVPGCLEGSVTAIDNADNQIVGSDPVPGDPWGACSATPNLVGDPGGSPPLEGILGVCSTSTAEHPETCTGFGSPWSSNTTIAPCIDAHAMCDHACATDADCPVPGTGTAVPYCGRTNSCWLPCDNGETCPQGLTCLDGSQWGLSDAQGPLPPAKLCLSVFTQCWDE